MCLYPEGVASHSRGLDAKRPTPGRRTNPSRSTLKGLYHPRCWQVIQPLQGRASKVSFSALLPFEQAMGRDVSTVAVLRFGGRRLLRAPLGLAVALRLDTA